MNSALWCKFDLLRHVIIHYTYIKRDWCDNNTPIIIHVTEPEQDRIQRQITKTNISQFSSVHVTNYVAIPCWHCLRTWNQKTHTRESNDISIPLQQWAASSEPSTSVVHHLIPSDLPIRLITDNLAIKWISLNLY